MVKTILSFASHIIYNVFIYFFIKRKNEIKYKRRIKETRMEKVHEENEEHEGDVKILFLNKLINKKFSSGFQVETEKIF